MCAHKHNFIFFADEMAFPQYKFEELVESVRDYIIHEGGDVQTDATASAIKSLYTTLLDAQRNGLTVDLDVGVGWPAGQLVCQFEQAYKWLGYECVFTRDESFKCDSDRCRMVTWVKRDNDMINKITKVSFSTNEVEREEVKCELEKALPHELADIAMSYWVCDIDRDYKALPSTVSSS